MHRPRGPHRLPQRRCRAAVRDRRMRTRAGRTRSSCVRGACDRERARAAAPAPRPGEQVPLTGGASVPARGRRLELRRARSPRRRFSTRPGRAIVSTARDITARLRRRGGRGRAARDRRRCARGDHRASTGTTWSSSSARRPSGCSAGARRRDHRARQSRFPASSARRCSRWCARSLARGEPGARRDDGPAPRRHARRGRGRRVRRSSARDGRRRGTGADRARRVRAAPHPAHARPDHRARAELDRGQGPRRPLPGLTTSAARRRSAGAPEDILGRHDAEVFGEEIAARLGRAGPRGRPRRLADDVRRHARRARRAAPTCTSPPSSRCPGRTARSRRSA